MVFSGDSEETGEEKIERKRLFLIQTPVFVYLEENRPDHKQLIDVIKDDSQKVSFLRYRDEFIWPAFLLCEQDESISAELVTQSNLVDSLADFSLQKKQDTASEEGILISLFGTNVFTRRIYSDIVPFEKVITATELSRFKKENFMMKFLRYSFYYFRILGEKEQKVTASNCKKAVHRLVFVEDSAKNTKSFAILLSL